MIATFQRIEKKYLLNERQYEDFLKKIEPYMQLDQYGLHTICNIYYDTEQFDLIRISLDKPVYKEKFRLRSYGVPGENDTVFLEIKKKYDGVVYKRRVAMLYKDAMNYLENGIIPTNLKDSQIMHEIAYFHQFYHPKKAMYLSYQRMAYFGKQDEELRMTFDTHITSREQDLELDKGVYGEELLEDGQHLLEIKIPMAMPMWLSSALTELQIYPVSFSKYGSIYAGKVAMERDKKFGFRQNDYLDKPENSGISHGLVPNYSTGE